MKISAFYRENDKGRFEPINVFDIRDRYEEYLSKNTYIEIEEFYRKFYKGKLFSTHTMNKIPLSLVHRRKPKEKLFFKFYDNYAEFDVGDESVSHSVYKDIISELSVLNLVVDNQNIKIYVEFCEIEYRFKANDNNFIADVFIWFNKSEPIKYFYKWNGKLCFEIKHTHQVEEKKKKCCCLEGIAIFEYEISKKLTFENIESSKSFFYCKNYIKKLLSEKIYGNLLSDPSSDWYVEFANTIKENMLLHNELENEKKYNVKILEEKENILNKYDELKNEIRELEFFKSKVKEDKIIRTFLKLKHID